MKKDYHQEIFVIAVLSIVVTTVWLYLSVFNALNKSEKPILTPHQKTTLNPKLDGSVFDELKKRKM